MPGSSVHGILQARIQSGLPFPSPGDLPNPGIELGSPALQASLSDPSHQGCPALGSSLVCSAPCWPDKFFFFDCTGSSVLVGFSLVAASRGYSLVAVCGLLIVVASLIVEHGLQVLGHL